MHVVAVGLTLLTPLSSYVAGGQARSQGVPADDPRLSPLPTRKRAINVTEPRIEARGRSSGVRPQELSAPLLYRSSAQAGWAGDDGAGDDGAGLRAAVFLMPRELESYRVP